MEVAVAVITLPLLLRMLPSCALCRDIYGGSVAAEISFVSFEPAAVLEIVREHYVGVWMVAHGFNGILRGVFDYCYYFSRWP